MVKYYRSNCDCSSRFIDYSLGCSPGSYLGAQGESGSPQDDEEGWSYLQISENGLVYRNWPFFEVRCKWEDVKCFKKSRWFGDILYVQRAEAVGFPQFSINLSPPQIHLSSLVGWHDGGLKADLQQYAPQLFQESS